MKKKSSQLSVGTSSNNNSHINDNNDNIITIMCHVIIAMDLTSHVEFCFWSMPNQHGQLFFVF